MRQGEERMTRGVREEEEVDHLAPRNVDNIHCWCSIFNYRGIIVWPMVSNTFIGISTSTDMQYKPWINHLASTLAKSRNQSMATKKPFTPTTNKNGSKYNGKLIKCGRLIEKSTQFPLLIIS